MSILVIIGLLVAVYLFSAIPFGFLVGRARGVNLFEHGSKNIGATNVGRVLGRPYAVLVFLLDFAKGALPVAVIVPIASAVDSEAPVLFGSTDWLRIGAAGVAFLGHLFPVYLGFRGGKGVATGAGVAFVLVPGPMLVALGVWILVAISTRYVSLASIAATVAVVASRILGTTAAFSAGASIITVFCLIGASIVILKHRANIGRLVTGTENKIGEWTMRQTMLKILHVLALGMWFGGAAFFNFVSAPAIFESFTKVVNDGPSDRTAYVQIIDPVAPAETKKSLASELAGSAVAPIFPKYFLMQAICGSIALVTALSWWPYTPNRVHRVRVAVIGMALVLVVVSWPISQAVSQLRVERFHPDAGISSSAKENFGPWHLVSLALSGVTTLLAGAGLTLAAKLPEHHHE